MSARLRIATIIFWFNAIVLISVGLAFVFASEFFPFHGQVIQMAWQDLDQPFQTLYLGMMRTEGAGYLAAGLALIILLSIPFKRNENWSAWAIASIGIVEHFPTLLATFHVWHTTPASPPWLVTAMLIASLMFGLWLTLRESPFAKS